MRAASQPRETRRRRYLFIRHRLLSRYSIVVSVQMLWDLEGTA